MEVIYKTYVLGDGDAVCVTIIKAEHKFWFHADTIAELLGH